MKVISDPVLNGPRPTPRNASAGNCLKRFLLHTFIAGIGALAIPTLASAHSIDFLASSISPASTFNGQSGNFSVTGSIYPGTQIQFTLTFVINTQGSTTTYPRTISFGATTTTKPSGAPDAVVSAIPNCGFTTSATTCPTPVEITAPATPGNYTVKIQATSGTGGQDGLAPGGGISISFNVAEAPPPQITDVATSISLSLSNPCIIVGTPTVSFFATLTTAGGPLPGMSVVFTLNGTTLGTAQTNASGVAEWTYDPSQLPVGDHSVGAQFNEIIAGNTRYLGSITTQTLGVQYNFVGFQQPINADGSSVFSGRVVPTKIKITDYNNVPVGTASAFIYYKLLLPVVSGWENEAPANSVNFDFGNQMRWDPVALQYVFNWDVGQLPNGTYNARVWLGEGSCSGDRAVTLSLNRKGK